MSRGYDSRPVAAIACCSAYSSIRRVCLSFSASTRASARASTAASTRAFNVCSVLSFWRVSCCLSSMFSVRSSLVSVLTVSPWSVVALVPSDSDLSVPSGWHERPCRGCVGSCHHEQPRKSSHKPPRPQATATLRVHWLAQQ